MKKYILILALLPLFVFAQEMDRVKNYISQDQKMTVIETYNNEDDYYSYSYKIGNKEPSHIADSNEPIFNESSWVNNTAKFPVSCGTGCASMIYIKSNGQKKVVPLH